METWKNKKAFQAKREIILKYMDLAGMVTVDRNPTPESTKNGLMHVGLYVCFLYRLNLLDTSDVVAFEDTVKSCEDVRGVYDRYPAWGGRTRTNDANAHDDYTGVFSASVLTNSDFHGDILSYGKKHCFVYNNIVPARFVRGLNILNWDWWAFRLRFFDHISWYYLGNNQMLILNIPLMLWITTKVLLKKKGSGVLLDYMIVQSLAKSSLLWSKYLNWFLKRSKLLDSVSDYFKPQNGYQHPLTVLAKEVCNVA